MLKIKDYEWRDENFHSNRTPVVFKKIFLIRLKKLKTLIIKKLTLYYQKPTASSLWPLIKKHSLFLSLSTKYRTGDVSCNCSPEEVAPIAFSNMSCQYELHNMVCGSFCEHGSTTLIGCSSCQLDGNQIMISNRLSDESTTPDWKELCAALCKTGDGGALCNCDLAPFF